MAPVLLITFNRPQYVEKMLSALRENGIDSLFVFRDGPRPNNEDDYIKTMQIEEIIKQIDWVKDVKTNFMQNNLGCGYGPYSAISWAFQYTEKLIILEDDCIPSKPFFKYCNYLLDKFEKDYKVRLISGRQQYEEPNLFYGHDYIFTQYAQTWGWATWKRVWKDFDMQQRAITPFYNSGGFTNQFHTAEEARFFNKRKYLIRIDEVFHSWDSQFGVHARMNGALSIVPSKNLIKYIGTEGTHPEQQGSRNELLSANDEYSITNEPVSVGLFETYEKICFTPLKNSQPCSFRLYLKRFSYYLGLALNYHKYF